MEATMRITSHWEAKEITLKEVVHQSSKLGMGPEESGLEHHL
jgi:hypothetical protein